MNGHIPEFNKEAGPHGQGTRQGSNAAFSALLDKSAREFHRAKGEAVVLHLIDAEDAAAREAAWRDTERRSLLAKTRGNGLLTTAENALLAAAGLAPEDDATTAATEGRNLVHNEKQIALLARDEHNRLVAEARKTVLDAWIKVNKGGAAEAIAVAGRQAMIEAKMQRARREAVLNKIDCGIVLTTANAELLAASGLDAGAKPSGSQDTPNRRRVEALYEQEYRALRRELMIEALGPIAADDGYRALRDRRKYDYTS
jgi:hypothetical protein